MGKPVTVDLTARAIVQGAMLAVDVDSRAKANPSDRYSAHLVFGGGAPKPGSGEQPVVSYWAIVSEARSPPPERAPRGRADSR